MRKKYERNLTEELHKHQARSNSRRSHRFVDYLSVIDQDLLPPKWEAYLHYF